MPARSTTATAAADERNYLVYCIRASATSQKTYIGCTNNFARRLRQHCGKLVGGARFTRGCATWRPVFHVRGLTKRESLQLEYALKHKRFPGVGGVQGRWKTLQRLLNSVERWTRNSPLLSEVKPHLSVVKF
jgi:predicted GIY-YIG superfamily endonuclease